jgi:hypothetical protein
MPVKVLGSIGPAAKEALPLLEDLARDRDAKPAPVVPLAPRPKWSAELRKAAETAVAKIKGGKKADR